MSLWNRAPRQVYMVHGEDDYDAGNDVTPGERMAPALDPSTERSRSGRVLGLTLLVVVTFGAVGLLSLSLSHAPAGRRPVAEHHALPAAARRAFPEASAAARAEIHQPAHSNRAARASIAPPAHPRRRYRRIAAGHSEIPKIVTAPAGDQPPGPASAGGEFGFER